MRRTVVKAAIIEAELMREYLTVARAISDPDTWKRKLLELAARTHADAGIFPSDLRRWLVELERAHKAAEKKKAATL